MIHASPDTSIGRSRYEYETVYIVGDFFIDDKCIFTGDIPVMIDHEYICSIIRHAFFIVSIGSTSEGDSSVTWLHRDIYDTKWLHELTHLWSPYSATREYLSPTKVYRRIIPLKKWIQKYGKEKYKHPKYSGCSTFSRDFMFITFDHSMNNYFLFIFFVVSKVSIRFPKKSRIWLSIAGIEKRVRVSMGTAIHWSILYT